MLKTHCETFLVRATDCDRFMRIRPDMLFIQMQEGGEHHAYKLGVGYNAMKRRGLFFALARIHLSVQRAPRCGETVVHTTWPGNSNRFFCPRFHTFTLEDGTPLASAGALWVMLDTVNRKIVSPKNVDLGFPDNSDLPDPVSLPMRPPAAPVSSNTISRTPVYSEFDINGHVNNTKYVAWLCDALGNGVMEDMYIGDLTASYEKEIREEIPLTLSLNQDGNDFSFLVSSEEGGKHFAASGSLRREE